jgi:hypothetical protein
MTHAACPDCQLRFTAAVGLERSTCPACQGPLDVDRSAADVLGCQLFFELRPDPAPFGAVRCED